MKKIICWLNLAAIAVLNFQLSSAFGQSTAFTYQGWLNDGTNAANGSYDFQFTIYDDDIEGGQWGPVLTNSATPVNNGQFTVTLDFGDQFSDGDRWLEIAVCTNGNGNFITLEPRQPITAAPYAIAAASVSPGGIPNGIYSNSFIFNNTNNQYAGNGAGITGLPFASLSADAQTQITNAATAAAEALIGFAGFSANVNLFGNFTGTFTGSNANFIATGATAAANFQGDPDAWGDFVRWQIPGVRPGIGIGPGGALHINSYIDLNGQGNWDGYNSWYYPNSYLQETASMLSFMPDVGRAFAIDWGTADPNDSVWHRYANCFDWESFTEIGGNSNNVFGGVPERNSYMTMGGDLGVRQITLFSNFAPSQYFSWTNAAANLGTNEYRLTPDGSNNVLVLYNNGLATNSFTLLTPNGIPARAIAGGGLSLSAGVLTNAYLYSSNYVVGGVNATNSVLQDRWGNFLDFYRTPTSAGFSLNSGSGLTLATTANGFLLNSNLTLLAGQFNGSGAGLTNIPVTAIAGLVTGVTTGITNGTPGNLALATNGTLTVSNLTASGKVTAAIFAGNGSGLTNLNLQAVAGISNGTPGNLALATNGTLTVSNLTARGKVSASSFAGNGNGLSNVNAAALTGKVPVASLSGVTTNITVGTHILYITNGLIMRVR